MEPTAGAVHSLIERMNLRASESVAILGPGARGLILLQIAKALGAYPVLIAGTERDVQKRLPSAKDFGAERVINIEEEDLNKIAQELTGEVGFDVVVENTGSSQAVSQALDIARPGGRVLISGGGIRGGVTAEIDTQKIIVKELDVKGEISHLWTSWNKAIDLVRRDFVNLEPLVSHIFPLFDWRKAFKTASASPDALRVAIKPE